MRYGAFRGRDPEDIKWFRTSHPIEAGFYSRHARHDGSPDVCISESVPALIMDVYSWIHEAEIEFQHDVASAGASEAQQSRLADQMTDQLVLRLDPDDDAAWVDDPRWIRSLRPVLHKG